MKYRKNILKIAVDSPAAAGAGTLCKAISKYYNLLYLDTGKIYRMIAYLKISNQSKYNKSFLKKKIKDIVKLNFFLSLKFSESSIIIPCLLRSLILISITLLLLRYLESIFLEEDLFLTIFSYIKYVGLSINLGGVVKKKDIKKSE